jgi:ATP/maltotriose-dependent transcriptional regulator MalT
VSSSSTLLATKLLIPVRRPNLVPRPQLIDRLDRGLHAGHKLTVICASTGYGKTTLATEWLHNAQHPVAWLSLDEQDNDPARFLAYLLTKCCDSNPPLFKNSSCRPRSSIGCARHAIHEVVEAVRRSSLALE